MSGENVRHNAKASSNQLNIATIAAHIHPGLQVLMLLYRPYCICIFVKQTGYPVIRPPHQKRSDFGRGFDSLSRSEYG